MNKTVLVGNRLFHFNSLSQAEAARDWVLAKGVGPEHFSARYPDIPHVPWPPQSMELDLDVALIQGPLASHEIVK